jgi:hypothetical protein
MESLTSQTCTPSHPTEHHTRCRPRVPRILQRNPSIRRQFTSRRLSTRTYPIGPRSPRTLRSNDVCVCDRTRQSQRPRNYGAYFPRSFDGVGFVVRRPKQVEEGGAEDGGYKDADESDE